MKFRTEIDLSRHDTSLRLDPLKMITAVGSCFSSNITVKMRESLWDAANPLGTLYNPASIASEIGLAIDDASRDKYRLFSSGTRWHTWNGDSSFSALNKDTVLDNLRRRDEIFRKRMEKSGALIITFGTAWCYYLNDLSGSPVANCHKMPGNIFVRRRLEVSEIVDIWRPLLDKIAEKYNDLPIIFTVSPVRHLRDGAAANSLSKSILRIATDTLCSEYPSCHYFPAFEIMMDDLRDYRFYASDMAHPSEEAIEYIWEKFKECYLREKFRNLLEEGRKLFRGLQHRSILETPEEREIRLKRLHQEISAFTRNHPGMLGGNQSCSLP